MRSEPIITKPAAAAFTKKVRVPIREGHTVTRDKDGEEFVVTRVEPWGIYLKGQEGCFNALGFTVVL
jgi:hypothetical protein